MLDALGAGVFAAGCPKENAGFEAGVAGLWEAFVSVSGTDGALVFAAGPVDTLGFGVVAWEGALKNDFGVEILANGLGLGVCWSFVACVCVESCTGFENEKAGAGEAFSLLVGAGVASFGANENDGADKGSLVLVFAGDVAAGVANEKPPDDALGVVVALDLMLAKGVALGCASAAGDGAKLGFSCGAAEPAGRELGRAGCLHHVVRRGRGGALRRFCQPEDAALADVHRPAGTDFAHDPCSGDGTCRDLDLPSDGGRTVAPPVGTAAGHVAQLT